MVDPDVGAQRRAVALRSADERLFVGPDNGLLWLAAQAGGGVVEAADIARSPLRLEPVSATFHGRDIFAPVAAHLAAGTPLSEVGEPCDPDDLVRLELPRPRFLGDGTLEAQAIYIDRFGNVQLNVEHEELTRTAFKLGRRSSSSWARAPSTRRRSRGRSPRSNPIGSFSTRTPRGVWPWRSATATRPRRLGIAVDDSVRIRLA